MEMKILITGHKGFVGRHFVKYFEARGDQVVGVDIKEGLDCREFFKSCYEKFDLVVHLAAIVGGREMIENEPLFTIVDFQHFNGFLIATAFYQVNPAYQTGRNALQMKLIDFNGTQALRLFHPLQYLHFLRGFLAIHFLQ